MDPRVHTALKNRSSMSLTMTQKIWISNCIEILILTMVLKDWRMFVQVVMDGTQWVILNIIIIITMVL